MPKVDDLPGEPQPHINLLAGLGALSSIEMKALQTAGARARSISARREVLHESAQAGPGSLLISGWAGRVRHFQDGRRQILHLLLPGDLIDWCPWPDLLTPTTITALTDLKIAPAAQPDRIGSGLWQAYVQSAAIEQGYLFRQIGRIGRFDAHERLADILLEIGERLERAGASEATHYHLPITQEMLGDLLGLTPVHVNRTLQHMRTQKLIELRGNLVRLLNVRELKNIAQYQSLAFGGPREV